MRKAVIDVGSNSVLLLIEELGENGWSTVYESTDVTSLGENTKLTGLLGDAGIAKTLEALRTAFAKSREFDAGNPVAAVTMAARIAKNTSEFLKRASEQQTPVTVLSGDDEAELGFRAVASDPTFSSAGRISIIDVGGQSTELTTADRTAFGWDNKFRRSYPIGTLALLGSTLKEECPSGIARLHACREIDEIVGLAYLPGQSGTAVALGATGTNLVSIREKMAKWDPIKVNGAVLGYEEISKAAEWLAEMTITQRSAIVGIERGREATLPIGALILERFLFALRAEECAVSVRGWRHALLEEGLASETTASL